MKAFRTQAIDVIYTPFRKVSGTPGRIELQSKWP